MTQTITPSVTLLVSTQCPHCATLPEHTAELIKSGELAHIEVINLNMMPEKGAELGVRSVPWLRIGDFVLTGSQTIAAIRQRLTWIKESSSLTSHFDQLLSTGKADKVIEHLQQHPEAISAIMQLLGDEGTVLSSRIGIGVVMEEFAGHSFLLDLIPKLGKLAHHQDSRIAVDTLYYLGLTGSERAIPILQGFVNHHDAELREAAEDSLETLGATEETQQHRNESQPTHS